MCGIVAYAGKRRAAPVLIDGLKKLEYRGYDSAGIAVAEGGRIHIFRRAGSVDRLEPARTLGGNVGIGHTRWATHGAPTEQNAHPHSFGRFAVVHNGIVENMLALKRECLERGEAFSSETDSEIVAHLLEHCYEGDLLAALRSAAARLVGSYALAVLCTEEPNVIAVARKYSPLVVGKGREGVFAASDLPAVAEEGAEIYALEDGEFALLGGDEVRIFNERGERVRHAPIEFDVPENTPEKGGRMHFMRKEMDEIPSAMRNSYEKTGHFFSNSIQIEILKKTRFISIVACGTAYHSGLCAKYAIERLARVRTEAEVASEYRYRDPIVGKDTLVIAISQSGETADTLAAAKLAKEAGAPVLAVTNSPYSSLTRIADETLLTAAGREIAVAATKSFNAQLMALYAFACRLARAKGREGDERILARIPALAEEALRAAETVRGWTAHFTGARSVFFLGRGADHCTALEGSLKLKEISYLPGEGYAAGELKHGTLALIEENTPVVAVLSSARLAEKTMNAVHEAYARGAKVFLVTSLPEYVGRVEVTASVLVPDCGELFSPALTVIPLQALAYYVSLARGNDPDKPRNLAKSVTVE